jgi:hypothetical protein
LLSVSYAVKVLKIGTLDDPSVYGGAQKAIFTAEGQPFHLIADGVPAFEGRRRANSSRQSLFFRLVHFTDGGKADIALGSPATWLLTQVDVRSLPSVTVCKPISILLHFS